MASTPKRADPSQVIVEIMALLDKVSEKFEPEYGETRQWMADHSGNPKITKILFDSSPTMLRVLNAVGQLEPVNGITISRQFHIPKGSVSKTTRKLIAQKLIKKESRPNNKKEMLFRLTPLGRELFEVHRAFDQQMERGFVRFLQRYEADQLQLVVRVLQDSIDTSFLDLGAQP
ncbi:MAG TPA: winged helix DNA-binding protein [Anaerolineae bacterium]|nr:winged helix DNA-binding protein [Anaerolineae bacterium]